MSAPYRDMPAFDRSTLGIRHRPQTPVFRTALVVDDHPLFCDALCMTLSTVASGIEISTAGTLAQAVRYVSTTDVDLIVLDLNLPDVDSLDGVVHMRTMAPKSALLVTSSMTDDAMVSGVLRAGADGFVPKHADRQVFATAVAAVCAGARYVPTGYIEPGTADGPTDDILNRMAALTQQQSRILALICQGKLNKQIAFDLSIAETTVKAHVTSIMRKLGVQSRTQAVLVAQGTRFEQVLPQGPAIE
ncbi:MAG: LuxR C-terminal-related transcriptional regulator [Primorskyibacter sp.]